MNRCSNRIFARVGTVTGATLFHAALVIMPLGAQTCDPVATGSMPSHAQVVSIEGSEPPYASPGQLEVAADYCIANHNYDQAISLCKRALAADDNDLDIHKSYAQALEGKLKDEHKKNSELFNACIREWLIVLRTERGPEKLPSFHGLQVPGYGHLNQDEEHGMVARMHLTDLAGHAPKPWETDEQYLKHVGEQTVSTVTGKMLPAQDDSTKPLSAKALLLPTKSDDPLDWMNH